MKSLLPALFLALPIAAEELPAPLALQTAANAFLASLDDKKQERATFPFDSEERENWHYTPRDRKGLPLKDMNEAQKNAAVALANEILSERGAMQAAQIISLESVLAKLENNPQRRDPEKYFVAIFGTPGDKDGWAIRFEGHHLSVNVTLVGDKGFSVTPSFMGTNPGEIREGELKGMRPLAAEEDLARALALTLLESGKKDVLFSENPPKEILTGEERVAKQLEPVGVLASEMTEAQQEALFELISQYTGRYRADLAEADMAKIKKAGMDKIRFGWAGSTKPREAYYYRVQGPTFLMEGCNVQNNANHMHAVWRDTENDFARDLLGEHLDGHE
ncbi:serine protease [Haloferula helveola]|uniref:Serine protease n=1 Tax=Haloferula helveola TaxID=490095 RepID=A0ABM7RGA7_9BACT|nr:serine protease [Haloferula helveola]